MPADRAFASIKACRKQQRKSRMVQLMHKERRNPVAPNTRYLSPNSVAMLENPAHSTILPIP
jgi:hypothetical protein